MPGIPPLLSCMALMQLSPYPRDEAAPKGQQCLSLGSGLHLSRSPILDECMLGPPVAHACPGAAMGACDLDCTEPGCFSAVSAPSWGSLPFSQVILGCVWFNLVFIFNCGKNITEANKQERYPLSSRASTQRSTVLSPVGPSPCSCQSLQCSPLARMKPEAR